MVQIGFLLAFLLPLALIVYERLTHRPAPIFSSWLLPWDPLLLAGHVARRDWSAIVIGAPLVTAALTLILGRFFCGWVCPLGTTLDLIRPLAFWRRGKGRKATGRGILARAFPANANRRLRYYILIGVLAAGVLSLQALGLLDPLVIFHRVTTALATSAVALQQSTAARLSGPGIVDLPGHLGPGALAAALLVPEPVPVGRAHQPSFALEPAQSPRRRSLLELRRVSPRLPDERHPAAGAA